MSGKFKAASVLALVLGIGGATAPVDAQRQQATVVLKNGQRHGGHAAYYRVDRGEVSVRKSLHDEPRFPVDQVYYLDFGGTPDKDVELSGSENAVVMRDGSVVKGQIIELTHDKGTEDTPFLVIFKTTAGEERRIPAGQVARVYFSGSPSAGTSGPSPSTPGVPEGAGIAVSGTQNWTPTGIVVRRGDSVTFEATGEIRLSTDAADTASPAGARSGKTAANAPLPQVATGTLIGRVGNSAPFSIGERGTLTMPANGQLFLGINDDHVQDNGGAFRVQIRRNTRR